MAAQTITELVIYPLACREPWLTGWLPCQQPERPLDEHAAVEHYRHGEPCTGCAVARDAAARRAEA